MENRDKDNPTEEASEHPLEEETSSKAEKKHFFRPKKEEEVHSEQVTLFHPDSKVGLTSEQVAVHVKEGQINAAPKKYSKTYRQIITNNVLTFFNLLCVLCAIALAVANAELSQFLFVPIFLSNIVIGVFQEVRSKIKIDKLTILTEPHTKVIRGGTEMEIPTHEIVLEDILVMEIGQQIPADCIIAEGVVEVNESLLTGESVAIKKCPGDTLFAGSFLTSGKCRLRVEKIGKQTYINQLTSRAKQYKKPKSEIMSSVHLFIRIIAILLVPITAGMFFRNWTALCASFNTTISRWATENNVFFAEIGSWDIFHIGFGRAEGLHEFSALFGENGLYATPDLFVQACRGVFNDSVQRTASVVIGMIPSGLLLLTSFALAIGVFRLAQNNTLVQDLYSLEMLARVNVLCLDKTGTITDGQMEVADYTVLNNTLVYPAEEILSSMLAALPDNNQTSIALHNKFGHNAHFSAGIVLPFSSARKYSAVTFKGVGTFALGAPEFILNQVPARVEKAVNAYAQQGLRVILLAYTEEDIADDRISGKAKPVALIALRDNIRKDAIETIAWFKENDVGIKVISGDNPITVSEVAKRAGVENADKYISLEGLSSLEVENVANEYTVFGRVTPEQKAILIRQIKASGDTVAMTGDGVNDILAMKEADCAISIASGSEAARNVSNIVLLDNNFSNMPKVVYEGRRVINNVKNSASLYLMKTFLTAILAVFCLLTGSTYFFVTSNMLLFELFIAAIPSVFLSLQPNTDRVQGKFITYVISRAFPGAFTLAFAVISMYFTSTPLFANLLAMGNYESIQLLPIDAEKAILLSELFARDYLALSFLALTFSGAVMLYRLCQPFNIMRGTLWGSALFLCLLCILTMPDFFYLGWSDLTFSFIEVLYLVFVLVLCFPLSKLLIRFFEKLNKGS